MSGGPVRGARLDERRARTLLARVAEPYDEQAHKLVDQHGVLDLMGYVVADGRTPDGVSLHRYRARLDQAWEIDDEAICRSLGMRILVPGDEEWPTGLDDLGDPPWCLWARGPVRLGELDHRMLAVVGARASTSYGDEMAMSLCHDLAGRGWAIVSGAAYGIDGAAHRAALGAGGTTVAVLASGADVAYPRANAQLIAAIAEQGVVVSETPPGGAPARMRFLARNRIIAALAVGTLVVEAGLRSGARNTVKHARDMVRHVMAVPGPVTSQASAGAHLEIRHGATLVTDAAEVLEVVGRIGEDLAPQKQGAPRAGDDLPPQLRRVWQWLHPRRSASVDEIVLCSGLGVSEVLPALADLEMRGLAEHLLDGWKRRAR